MNHWLLLPMKTFDSWCSVPGFTLPFTISTNSFTPALPVNTRPTNGTLMVASLTNSDVSVASSCASSAWQYSLNAFCTAT